jgi:hypothetical protein
MSLFSILAQQSSSSSALTYGSSATSTSAAVQKLLDARTAALTTSQTASAATADNGVSISTDALEAADNAKDFSTLSSEVRITLDTQYANGGKKGAPDLTKMTGRALAAIALNKDGQFNRTEQMAAKAELRDRTKADFASLMQSGTLLSAVSSYGAAMVTSYDAMSSEEREARGWTTGTHDSAAQFVQKALQGSILTDSGD